jgi:hypothetical protein
MTNNQSNQQSNSSEGRVVLSAIPIQYVRAGERLMEAKRSEVIKAAQGKQRPKE